MPGVLLVSMTTVSGSIKISGANGAGRAGVTPKEDKHNYREIDRQSGNGEVCKQVSQPDRYCKQSVSNLLAEASFIPTPKILLLFFDYYVMTSICNLKYVFSPLKLLCILQIYWKAWFPVLCMQACMLFWMHFFCFSHECI